MSRPRHEVLRYGAIVSLGLLVDLASARALPLRYLGALTVTMLVRAATVRALELVLPDTVPPLVILTAAVGVSFVASFLLAKYWVVRQAEKV